MVDFTITLHDMVCDIEIENLAETMSENGITDFTVTDSRRIIIAETEREDDAVHGISRWLSQSLFRVEDIALIKEVREYWPEFEEEEKPRGEIDVEIRFDEDT